MTARIALALLILACAACTPTRSTIRPPYELDGKTYDESQIRVEAERQCTLAGNARPEHEFTTDGCSVWPDSSWRTCCIKHDLSYWCGGTSEQRKAADARLRQCVQERSRSFNAHTMYFGVRLGGWRWMPFPWRWGYGHDWPFRAKEEREPPENESGRGQPPH